MSESFDPELSSPDLAGKRFRASSVEDLEELGAEKDTWTISNNQKMRLDKYVAHRIKSMSRNQAQRLLDMGAVTVNGKIHKASYKLREGDVLEVLIPPRPAIDIGPEALPLEILFEDEHFLAVNKPRHIIVHPARSHLTGTMLNALVWHFQQHPNFKLSLGDTPITTTDIPQEVEAAESTETTLAQVGEDNTRPGVIHRLDKDTTGCMLFGKKESAHWLIASQFEFRTAAKSYLAVVHGCPEPLSGVIEQSIGKHPTIREAMCVRNDSGGKQSVTLYRVRERYQGYSLVELELKTGRTHQIRVHMTHLGHPLVGDQLYGGEMVGPHEITEPPFPSGGRPYLNYARTREEGAAYARMREERLDENHPLGPVLMDTPALHAAWLRIQHPESNQPMTFTAPLHDPMRQLVHELRKHPHADGLSGVNDGTVVDLNQAIPL